MGSVDGRLLTDRWTEPYNGKSKGELMGIYAAIGRQLNTDVWMFGKNTLCEGYFPKKFHTQDTTPLAHPAPFIAEGDSIVCILPETAPAFYLEYLQKKGISYLFAGSKGDDLRTAMHTLAEAFGVESLSLQGGGIIDGAFLQAGLIDELSLVIYPGIDGSAGSTSIFHYIGKGNPSQGQSLELLSVKEMEDGVVWLRYKFHKNS